MLFEYSTDLLYICKYIFFKHLHLQPRDALEQHARPAAFIPEGVDG